MTKTNFDKISKSPMYLRAPQPEDEGGEVAGYGAVRAEYARSKARRTGRNAQFATVVTPEFKVWMKVMAAKRKKSQAALLDDMKAAYIEKYGD